MRNINQAGFELIKKFEGVRNVVYLDPVNKPTVGIGHLLTIDERKKWKVGTRLSDSVIQELFEKDIDRFENAVERLVKVPITDNQFAALVSFMYNIGEGAFKESTLLRLLNQRKYKEASQQFARWNRAGGKILLGLTRRRAAEAKLFMSDDCECSCECCDEL